MPVVLANNAVSRLSATLSTGATAVSITPGEGAKFPSPSVGNWFPLTIAKASGALEIVRCTSRSGDVLTVARAQEGTAAQPFSVGDRVELRLTTGVIQEIQENLQNAAETASGALAKDQNLSDLPDKSVARSNLELGNAARGTITESAFDRTAGRLLKVGDAGINSEPATGPNGENTPLDSYKYSGFWDASALSGTLIGNYPQVITIGGADRSMQIGGPVLDENRLFFRKFYGGEWKVAKEFFHTGNISAYIQTLLPAANAAAARATLGAPAGVDKQMCTAWVSFSGISPATIKGSHNVSSVTYESTGQYRINFATDMISASYAMSGMAGANNNDGNIVSSITKTTASAVIYARRIGGGIDLDIVDVSVFGGK